MVPPLLERRWCGGDLPHLRAHHRPSLVLTRRPHVLLLLACVAAMTMMADAAPDDKKKKDNDSMVNNIIIAISVIAAVTIIASLLGCITIRRRRLARLERQREAYARYLESGAGVEFSGVALANHAGADLRLYVDASGNAIPLATPVLTHEVNRRHRRQRTSARIREENGDRAIGVDNDGDSDSGEKSSMSESRSGLEVQDSCYIYGRADYVPLDGRNDGGGNTFLARDIADEHGQHPEVSIQFTAIAVTQLGEEPFAPQDHTEYSPRGPSSPLRAQSAPFGSTPPSSAPSSVMGER